MSSSAPKPKKTISATKRKPPRPRARFSDEYGVLLDRLIKERKAAGITQQEIADKMGKAQSHISLIETREREISVIDLMKWCHAMNLRFADFVDNFEKEVDSLGLLSQISSSGNSTI